MKFWILIVCLTCLEPAKAQELPESTKQQLEDLAQSQESLPEDEGLMEELEHFRKHPVNINQAGVEDLRAFFFLSAFQVESLIRYRELLGYLVDIHELQAVPGWDIYTIRKILPYITVAASTTLAGGLFAHTKKGEHHVLIRAGSVREKKTTGRDPVYLGGPLRIFFRYRYQYKNSIQWGITGDKDAGESFFGKHQRGGFDFYSAHFMVRNRGIIQAIALGDYTVNMGQGLIHWQGLAFGKGADLATSKRQAPVIRPYGSSGEINFMRGAALSLRKAGWHATVLFSYRKTDANLYYDSSRGGSVIQSFPGSGYHRTEVEIEEKGNARILSTGGNISFKKNHWHAGINAMYYRFSHPLEKRDDPYQYYSMRGIDWGNLGLDHSYTFRNLHVFGEFAIDRNLNRAWVEGIMLSTSHETDLAFVLRIIGPAYQSLYGNAFTEGSMPSNESGLYSMITIRPFMGVKIDACADLFRFPWLKYRVDAPSAGSDYFIQFGYTPKKQSSFLLRFRARHKQVNESREEAATKTIIKQSALNWRCQLFITLSPGVSIRSRLELNWFTREGSEKQDGFMTYTDLIYKPPGSAYGFTLRAAVFDSETADTRFYIYENSVLYHYSIPVYSGKGFRYYINAEYDIAKDLTLWGRWAQTFYQGYSPGREDIPGNKSEWTLQWRWKF